MTQFDMAPDRLAGPERTSILAVLALICAVVCIVPGLGLLGVLLGVGALMGIGASQGRIGGKGLAISGVVIGLLVTLLWAGAAYGAGQAWKIFEQQIAGTLTSKVQAIEQGDFDTARSLFTTAVQPEVTDEALTAFRDAYTAQLGSLQGPPDGFGAFMKAYAGLGQVMQQYQGRNDVIPVPVNFANGQALMLVFIDQTASGGSADLSGMVKDLHMTPMPDGSTLELVPGS